jgi:broad specificity phosphatase PhoE
MIILIRHAESTANITKNSELNPDLSENGIKQCLEMKELLVKYKDYRVLSSTLQRTIKTALLTGFTYVTQNKNLNEYNHSIESFNDFRKRVLTFVNELKELKNTGNENIIVFGHGCFFSVLLSFISSNENFLPKNGKNFQLTNCSITEISHIKKNQWTIHSISNK